uniref:F-box domain-containing protein n=1 Tax=Panagrolaimus sp. JU765 TaxID=591449 RepID=A0AC34R1C5_9BILA
MATNDYFPFMDLPQLVQEMITDEVIQNLSFIDGGQFCLTSKILYVYDNLFNIGELKFWKFKNIDNVAKFLQMIEINCIFANSASIRLHYKQKGVKDVLEGIGKFEISVDEFGENFYKIKTGVKIIKELNDDEVAIVLIIGKKEIFY